MSDSKFMCSKCSETLMYCACESNPLDSGNQTDRLESTINQLRAELDQEQNQIALCKLESETLAMSIYNKSYKDDSPNFELCDTPAGVLTQIDNMVAGLYQELEQVKKERDELEPLVKQAYIEGYVENCIPSEMFMGEPVSSLVTSCWELSEVKEDTVIVLNAVDKGESK